MRAQLGNGAALALAAVLVAALPAAAQDTTAAPAPAPSGQMHRHGQMQGRMGGQMQGNMQGQMGAYHGQMSAMHGQAMQGRGMMGGGMMGGMTPGMKEALAAGEGLGMGRMAEAHGYPGPRHVLEWADSLGLSADQKAKLSDLYASSKSKFVQLGQDYVDAETRLEAAFAGDSPPSASEVEKRAKAVGEAFGALRAAHLATHLRTRAILTDAQAEKYSSMRQSMGPEWMGGMQGQNGRMGQYHGQMMQNGSMMDGSMRGRQVPDDGGER
jgi:Spy/CpxP family protein refolding chaperone